MDNLYFFSFIFDLSSSFFFSSSSSRARGKNRAANSCFFFLIFLFFSVKKHHQIIIFCPKIGPKFQGVSSLANIAVANVQLAFAIPTFDWWHCLSSNPNLPRSKLPRRLLTSLSHFRLNRKYRRLQRHRRP